MRATARWAAALLCVAMSTAQVPVRAESAALPPPFTADTGWALQLPAEDKLVFRGMANLDGAGTGSGGMLYPAPSAAGFLAALITHGILVESTKNSQKQKLQEAADRVLLPYQALLDGYGASQALQRALAKSKFGQRAVLTSAAQEASVDWKVEVLPVFSMTQDERALILDAAVVTKSRNEDQPAVQGWIRVVSTPREEADIQAHWMTDNGFALKEEAAAMLAAALDMALEIRLPARPMNPAAQKTFRYRAGSVERFERAELVSEDCERLIVRNLRGILMSIPVKRDAGARMPADCAPAQPA